MASGCSTSSWAAFLARTLTRAAMFDSIFILIGCGFLGASAWYAAACDYL